MAKYQLLRDRVARELPQVRMAVAPRASDGELALAHDPVYIQAVTDGSLGAAAMREIGLPRSVEMVERSRRSAGATVAAARAALADDPHGRSLRVASCPCPKEGPLLG